jgi:hypothetical protein
MEVFGVFVGEMENGRVDRGTFMVDNGGFVILLSRRKYRECLTGL